MFISIRTWLFWSATVWLSRLKNWLHISIMNVTYEPGWLHRTNSLYSYPEMHVGRGLFGKCIHGETINAWKQLHIRLGQISVKRWHKITCSYFPSFLLILKAVFLSNVSWKIFKRLPTVNLIRQVWTFACFWRKLLWKNVAHVRA